MARSLNKKFFGPTSNDGSQIQATVKFGAGAAEAAFIVKQVSARRYLFESVGTPGLRVKATLVDLATPTVAGTASILVSPFGGGSEYAKKITAKKVTTYSGNTYAWGTSQATVGGRADIIADGERVETATATCILNLDAVDPVITITNGGGAYKSVPTVTFTGDGTTAATATAVLTNGVVTSITLIDGGEGYTVAPTITISAP